MMFSFIKSKISKMFGEKEIQEDIISTPPEDLDIDVTKFSKIVYDMNFKVIQNKKRKTISYLIDDKKVSRKDFESRINSASNLECHTDESLDEQGYNGWRSDRKIAV